jgi:hypothetical protein
VQFKFKLPVVGVLLRDAETLSSENSAWCN